MTKKPKPEGYVFGRPRNKEPTEKVQIRLDKLTAAWLRRNKERVKRMAKRERGEDDQYLKDESQRN